MNDIKCIIKDVEKSNLVSDKVIKKVITIIGQEEWNNIHNEESDICTTTGELIITLKGIEELEKENIELKAEKLTKAKDILTRWIKDNPCTVSEQKDLIKDTEQFLSEVEK